MSLLFIKGGIALAVMLVTFLSGYRTLKKEPEQDQQTHLTQSTQALACGIFLGAGLLHMLGESNHAFYELHIDYPFAELITGIVFLSFLWLEHLGQEVFHSEGRRGASFALIATVMLATHSFFEGAAIGLSHELPIMVTIFVAILAHKSLASFSLAVQLEKSSLNYPAKIICFIAFCLMAPLGILTGHYSVSNHEQIQLIIPVLNAAAGGTFLYLGTLHGLDYAVMVKRCCHLREFAFLVLGFMLMAIVAVYT